MKRTRIFMLFAALMVGISSMFAQNATADKMYNEGVRLMGTMTINSQNAAIQKFTSAKKLYDSAANKQKCDGAISMCRKNIKKIQGGGNNPGGENNGGYSGTSGYSNGGGYPAPQQGRLDYADWNGGWKNGQPHGTGTMTYKEEHLIDSRDPKGRTAQPGESVTGEWSDGHLVMGRWTKSDGSKESIIIGKSE